MVQINNRAIQDMHIFGDPMRVPIVIIERVWNSPKRTFSDRLSMRHVDKIDSNLLNEHDDENGSAKHNIPQHSGRELKIVVFVHGFQASIKIHIVLLSLKLYFQFVVHLHDRGIT